MRLIFKMANPSPTHTSVLFSFTPSTSISSNPSVLPGSLLTSFTLIRSSIPVSLTNLSRTQFHTPNNPVLQVFSFLPVSLSTFLSLPLQPLPHSCFTHSFLPHTLPHSPNNAVLHVYSSLFISPSTSPCLPLHTLHSCITHLLHPHTLPHPVIQSSTFSLRNSFLPIPSSQSLLFTPASPIHSPFSPSNPVLHLVFYSLLASPPPWSAFLSSPPFPPSV